MMCCLTYDVLGDLEEEMSDLFFRNIFHLLTSVTLSPVFSPPQPPNLHFVIKTRKEKAQYAYDILQKCSLCS